MAALPSASVLFADFVDSTRLFAEMRPAEIVGWLNEVFSTNTAGHMESHGEAAKIQVTQAS